MLCAYVDACACVMCKGKENNVLGSCACECMVLRYTIRFL